MLTISGNCRGRNRLATFEANQLDEGWEIVIRCVGDRIEETTLALSPYPVIEKLIAEAFDRAGKQAAPLYDLTKKKAKASRGQPDERQKRVRKQPHGLVTAPDSTAQFEQRVMEAVNAEKQSAE